MKHLAFFSFLVLFLSSCIKYEEPKLLSLSGEYRVDKITYEKVDNSSSTTNYVYYPGDLYVNPNDIDVIDTIQVGFFRLHMDYSMIRFKPTQTQSGSTFWAKEYYYYVQGQNTQYDLGYIVFDCDGTRRVWKIIDDGAESLVIRTSGQWENGNAGANESVTIHLTRVGP